MKQNLIFSKILTLKGSVAASAAKIGEGGCWFFG